MPEDAPVDPGRATMSDDELITRAKDGDPEAWRELYAAHAGRLLAWLRLRPTRDAAVTAEDVASETWYVAASKIHDFRGTSADFVGWLFGTARRVAANARRTAERRATSPQEPETLVESSGPAEDHALVHERLDWIRSVLAPLSPRERDAIGLVDVLGLDSQSAAEALGITVTALRVARHRGLRRLRREQSLAPAMLVEQRLI